MPKAKTGLKPKPYSNNEIDLILIEALGLTAYQDGLSDIPFEWLIEYSQISLEELA